MARHKPGHPSLALVPSDIAGTASKHGAELRRQGLTVDEVVHDYGDLCQALTELAMERDQAISVDEFHTFNKCSDNAIADAVTAYADEGPVAPAAPDATALGVREQMRILVETALHSFAAIKSGKVATQGATAAAHERSLLGLRDLAGRISGSVFESGRRGPGWHHGKERIVGSLRAIISPAAPR